MDLRQAFHKGRLEGNALRAEATGDVSAMKQEVLDFVERLRTLKTENGKKAFDVVDRDFIKSHDSFVIWANSYGQSMTLDILDEQPLVRMETKINTKDADGETSTLLVQRQIAVSADDAIEKICHWIGQAAPELESAFDDTFEEYDFHDVAP